MNQTSNYKAKFLINLNDKDGNIDPWTVDDALRGISILGATGSGKSSTSGKKIAYTYLNEGWGGVVLTVKPDEVKTWINYCKETNRLDDLIIFGENSEDSNGNVMVFNPLDYEFKRGTKGSGDTQNIINIFMNIYRMGNRIAHEGDISNSERFWDSAMKRILGRMIELLKLADESLSMENMYNILLSCSSKDENGSVLNNQTLEHCSLVVKGKANKEMVKKYCSAKYYCPMCIALADLRLDKENAEINDDTNRKKEFNYKERQYNQIKDYFFQFLNSMAEKTKTTIIEMVMGIAEPFLSGVLNKHFAGENNLSPEVVFDKKIIVVNFPVKEYLDVGIIAQSVFKLLFQQAVERRIIVENETKPVFLWADEAHMFVNPYDQLFLTTARSAMCSTVYITQSISNYYAVMGSGSDSKAKVDSLMGNLTTKIFHTNADAETNEYASRLIGNYKGETKVKSSNEGFMNMNFSSGTSINETIMPQVFPRQFTMLMVKISEEKVFADAIVFITGKPWSNKKNFIETTFAQPKNNMYE